MFYDYITPSWSDNFETFHQYRKIDGATPEGITQLKGFFQIRHLEDRYCSQSLPRYPPSKIFLKSAGSILRVTSKWLQNLFSVTNFRPIRISFVTYRPKLRKLDFRKWHIFTKLHFGSICIESRVSKFLKSRCKNTSRSHLNGPLSLTLRGQKILKPSRTPQKPFFEQLNDEEFIIHRCLDKDIRSICSKNTLSS